MQSQVPLERHISKGDIASKEVSESQFIANEDFELGFFQ